MRWHAPLNLFFNEGETASFEKGDQSDYQIESPCVPLITLQWADAAKLFKFLHTRNLLDGSLSLFNSFLAYIRNMSVNILSFLSWFDWVVCAKKVHTRRKKKITHCHRTWWYFLSFFCCWVTQFTLLFGHITFIGRCGVEKEGITETNKPNRNI